jgi:hypothetical protein
MTLLLQLRLLLLLLQRRPWNARLGYFPTQPARATFGTAIHPWASIRERASTTATIITTTTTAITVATINVTITSAACGGGADGVAGFGRVGGVCGVRRGTAGAGAAEGDGEVFGRDEIEERRMLVGLICAEDRDLVQRARGKPWLDHTPDSGERCWRVHDDELAHTTII